CTSCASTSRCTAFSSTISSSSTRTSATKCPTTCSAYRTSTGFCCSNRSADAANSTHKAFSYTLSKNPLPSVRCTLCAQPITLKDNSSSLIFHPVNPVNPVKKNLNTVPGSGCRRGGSLGCRRRV